MKYLDHFTADDVMDIMWCWRKGAKYVHLEPSATDVTLCGRDYSYYWNRPGHRGNRGGMIVYVRDRAKRGDINWNLTRDMPRRCKYCARRVNYVRILRALCHREDE